MYWYPNFMKIAIIDSGINREYVDFVNTKMECQNIIDGTDDVTDFNGHGTESAGEIVRINNVCELLILKVLDQYGKTSLLYLYNALCYCLEDKSIDIINLSLSCDIVDNDVKDMLEGVIRELRLSGVVIICSVANKYDDLINVYGYPAAYEGVIKAKHEYAQYNSMKYIGKSNECIYRGSFHLMPYKNGRYIFYRANSSAAAKTSAIISRIKDFNVDKDYLFDAEMIETIRYCDNQYSSDVRRQIKQYCERKQGVSNIIKIDSDNCMQLLCFIEERFKLKFDYKLFSVEHFFVNFQKFVDLN